MSTPEDYDQGRTTEPLLVKPKVAWKMLACGNTRGYELIAAGELDSFLDGRSRKITVESIHRYIQKRLKQRRHQTRDGVADAPSTARRGMQ
jgi:hypothetical protein